MDNMNFMESSFENKNSELLMKGDLDFRNAVLSLVHVQSTVVVYSMRHKIAEVMENSKEFQKEVSNIDKASSDIEEISYKTRMLSLNAAIEAARAGDAGKGFGVVAKEIGSLSTQTTKCTDEVNKINKNILKNAEMNQETLDKLESYLERFSKSNNRVMLDIQRYLVIEENGFIITTLAKRLENHADFIRNLLNNAGKAKLTDHNTCAFGIWYAQNKEKYKHVPGYEAVYEPHKAFHDEAAEFNKTMDLEALIKLLEHSHEVLDKFMMLEVAFKNEVLKGGF
ncbi:MAG: methyl-accepting chemotaxis protein [Synergistaceae bacterium]|nr:methyl-accepting chemotaxis protein [Synergistaceae bacterium]